ncbi:MAG: response regulator [Turicibacter sp.]|nr:response regulator [Turicibacter sp.]
MEARLLGSSGDKCCLSVLVKDNGIGISEEAQAGLFMMFEQADSSSSRKYGGTGLGLAISKRLITLMGGAITVASKEGVGSCFEITVELQAGSEGLPILDENKSLVCQTKFPGKKILIAEDIEINREIIAHLLSESGAILEFAHDGAEAVKKVLASPDAFDLVLMDIHMPIMDGFKATAEIRSQLSPTARQLPIVAMTADVFAEDIELCLEAGMDGHIGKPLDLSEVMGMLNKFL